MFARANRVGWIAVMVVGIAWAQEPASSASVAAASAVVVTNNDIAVVAPAPATNPAASTVAPAPAETPSAAMPELMLKPAVRTNAMLQIALDRQGFGSGLIDGVVGAKSHQALADFCVANGGLKEKIARQRLVGDAAAAFVPYEITADDLAQIGDAPADWEVAAKLPAMACHSLPELLSEKFHSGQGFLRTLNPAVLDWQTVAVGQRIWVPNVRPVEWKTNLAQVMIDTHEFRLRGYDTTGHLLCSFPCSIARNREKVPTNDLTVVNIAPNPNYTFDPANFPESARAKQIGHKLILPPGPRNPVGVYWISLSQPGYGMHGTPHPETIGNMESHGCFRLCNWDARTLGNMIAIGMPVLLDEPPRVLTPVAVAPAAAKP